MDRSPRIAVPLAAGLLGFLAVVAVSQPPQPSREARRLELADLIREEDARVRGLRATVRDLREEIGSIARDQRATGREMEGLLDEIDLLAMEAGAAAVEGPGVVVTLEDSDLSRSPSGDPNDLLIHERDIQTAVNALWAGGAEAVAINGEPLLGTSAVRCAGNTLLLHGTLHSPPYRIEAVGDPEALGSSLAERPGMDRLLAAADAFGLGVRVEPAVVEISSHAPADLELARPVSR